MNVTVIGAGNMGSAFVKQLTSAGHQVRVTARDISKAKEVAAAHTNATAVAAAGAADGADVVILATPYPNAVEALKEIGGLDGKVIVDITNPLTDDYMGLTVGHTTSAAEDIARAVPQATVVKAFNTLFAQVLAEGADFGDGRKATVFVAGDDDAAKRTVESLGYGAGAGTSIAPTWIRRS